MKRAGWIGTPLLVVLLLVSFVHSAGAQTAGFLSIDGVPLKIVADNIGNIGVYRWQLAPGTSTYAYVQQFYGGDHGTETHLLLNGAATSFPPTGVSVTKPDAWTIVSTTKYGAAQDITVQLTIKYTNGSAYYTMTWTVTNTGSTTYGDVRLMRGGDTYFAGYDSSRGYWDPTLRMVYLANPDQSITGLMGFYGKPASGIDPGSPASHYYEDYYGSVWAAIDSSAHLSDTVNANYVDAGYALEWDKASLAPGETWTIQAFEKWTQSGLVQVLAPADQSGYAGNTMTYVYRIQNFQTASDTFDLSLASSNGWTTSLPGGNSVAVGAGATVSVTARVTIPANATVGTTDRLTLTATSRTDTTVTNADTVTTSVVVPTIGPYIYIGDYNGDGQFTAADYYMMSVPGTPTTDSPLYDFSGGAVSVYDPSVLRVFQYIPSSNTTVEYPGAQVAPVSPGQGYWVVSSRASTTISLPGTYTPATQSFSVVLHPGWNMVGYPFAAAQSVTGVQVAGGAAPVVIGSPSNVWVENQVWTWDHNNGYTGLVAATPGTLQPWKAYWFHNVTNADVSLIFPAPPAASPGGYINIGIIVPAQATATAGVSKVLRATVGLSFILKEKSKSYQDKTLFLGMNSMASAGPDSFDCVAPPPVSAEFPRAYVDHTNWPVRPGKYAVDVRPLSQSAVFSVTVEVPKKTVATTYVLQWSGAGTLPATARVTLSDPAKGRAMDMRAQSSYEIVVPANSTKYLLSVNIQR